MPEHNKNVWGIILAGGEGKRLQSFIRKRYGSNAPKQYCAFTGTRSMLRHTIDRAEMLIRSGQLITIVSKQHVRYFQKQLCDRPSGTIIVQPFNRETGPGFLYPLLHIYRRDAEATVCLFPSDHFVLNERTFMNHVELASEYVSVDPQSVVLLGMKPQQGEGEYGWIVTGRQIANSKARQIHSVTRFIEKPDVTTAHDLYNNGSLWNTMVIIGKAKRLFALFKIYT